LLGFASALGVLPPVPVLPVEVLPPVPVLPPDAVPVLPPEAVPPVPVVPPVLVPVLVVPPPLVPAVPALLVLVVPPLVVVEVEPPVLVLPPLLVAVLEPPLLPAPPEALLELLELLLDELPPLSELPPLLDFPVEPPWTELVLAVELPPVAPVPSPESLEHDMTNAGRQTHRVAKSTFFIEEPPNRERQAANAGMPRTCESGRGVDTRISCRSTPTPVRKLMVAAHIRLSRLFRTFAAHPQQTDPHAPDPSGGRPAIFFPVQSSSGDAAIGVVRLASPLVT
jgi:hypothetical protein